MCRRKKEKSRISLERRREECREVCRVHAPVARTVYGDREVKGGNDTELKIQSGVQGGDGTPGTATTIVTDTVGVGYKAVWARGKTQNSKKYQ